MRSNPRYSIVIPAYNEEEVISQTLEEIRKKAINCSEVIVVNDQSSDNTGKVVSNFVKKYNKVRLVSTPKNQKGFAAALKVGISKTKSDYIIVVMADLCDEIELIDKMYERAINGKWDIVCGSRYMKKGRKIGGPLLQGILSKFVCRSLKVLTNIPTADVTNAFKLYHKRVFRNVNFNLNSGVEASMEITFQAFYNGVKMTELPTVWRGREVGVSKFKILQRAPRYSRICFWAIENSIRKRFGIKLKKFYV